MAEQEHCPHCGTKMQTHKHSMSKYLVGALLRVFALGSMNPVRLCKAGLSGNEMSNFQKLKYWGLVDSHITQENNHRRGWWRVTEKGRRFLHGEETVPRWVRTFRNKTVESGGDMIGPRDIIEGWRLRGDYVADARPLHEPVSHPELGMSQQ